jgi:alkylated DNA repair protein (DNA oxidative demethylase)
MATTMPTLGHTADLFGDADGAPHRPEPVADGAVLLREWASADEAMLLHELAAVVAAAPLRQMVTPGGHTMQVRTTSCGQLGWVSDRRGYRYATHDPLTGEAWPAMPSGFDALAQDAARVAGFANFTPDACLINRYGPGTRLSLHQDRNERDFNQPVVSVSWGVPAVFLLGGLSRSDRALRLTLQHGDVLVWGGPARLRFHGVMPVAQADHPAFGSDRVNLTFRRAG